MLPVQSIAFEPEPLPEVATPSSIPGKDFFRVEEIDRPLIPVSQVPPVYPLRAKRKGIEGWVKVKFLVTEVGAVEQVRILSAEPRNMFEESVLKTVSTWRFKPGTVDGKRVKTWASTHLEFKLQ
jgi:protein TonB